MAWKDSMEQQLLKTLQRLTREFGFRKIVNQAHRPHRSLSAEPLESRFLMTIDSPLLLSSIVASGGVDGTVFQVEDQGDKLTDVHPIGDFNGDGYNDFAMGSPDGDPNGSFSGQAAIVFGQPSGLPATFDTGNLNGTNGFRVEGMIAADLVGRALGGGDINGDGLSDVIVAVAGGEENDRGQALVVFGTSSTMPALIDTSWADGNNGFVIQGEADGDFLGFSLSEAGDMNGDGLQDMVLGAYLADPGTTTNAGKAYVLYGEENGFGALVELAFLDGVNGFKLFGENDGDFAGYHVSAGGDINGDGLDDVLIAAPFASPNGRDESGRVYVVYGQAGPRDIEIPLALLDGSDGFFVEGDLADDHLGTALGDVGDFNGDGFDDFTIGAEDASGSGLGGSGDVYLVYGGGDLPAVLAAADIVGNHGLFFAGVDAGDGLGKSANGAGDMNGDGYDDLIFGANNADGINNSLGQSGEAFVVWGGANVSTGLSISDLDGSNGFAMLGIKNDDSAGFTTNSAGDTNGDGFDDIVVGAFRGGIASTGEAYLLYGGDHSDAVDELGGDSNDTLLGDSTANVIVGGGGDDMIVGFGGADALRGGSGDDVLSVADSTFLKVNGGSGTDTLRWDPAGGLLDLTVLPDNRLIDIEEIDLAGMNTTLLLGPLDLLRLSSTSNTLTVTGDSSDSVPLDNSWTFVETEMIDNRPFDVFENGLAILKLDQEIGSGPPMAGDFDFDGDLDCADIDSLISEMLAGTNNTDFDLNADTFVDIGDLNIWVLNLKGTLFGDANLDFVVDVSDFNLWNMNRFTSNTSWCSGNFNGDTVTDVGDFNIWNSNKFRTALTAASETENATQGNVLYEQESAPTLQPMSAAQPQLVELRFSDNSQDPDSRAENSAEIVDRIWSESNINWLI